MGIVATQRDCLNLDSLYPATYMNKCETIANIYNNTDKIHIVGEDLQQPETSVKIPEKEHLISNDTMSKAVFWGYDKNSFNNITSANKELKVKFINKLSKRITVKGFSSDTATNVYAFVGATLYNSTDSYPVNTNTQTFLTQVPFRGFPSDSWRTDSGASLTLNANANSTWTIQPLPSGGYNYFSERKFVNLVGTNSSSFNIDIIVCQAWQSSFGWSNCSIKGSDSDPLKIVINGIVDENPIYDELPYGSSFIPVTVSGTYPKFYRMQYYNKTIMNSNIPYYRHNDLLLRAMQQSNINEDTIDHDTSFISNAPFIGLIGTIEMTYS